MPGRTVQISIMKWVTAVVAAYTALMGQVPEPLEGALWTCFALISLDTITGIWVAARRRIVRSHSVVEMLISKLLQYAILLALAGAAAVAMKNAMVLMSGFGLIAYVEVMSLIENMTELEKCGGAPLGPMRPFLRRVSRYLAVNTDEQPTEDSRR